MQMPLTQVAGIGPAAAEQLTAGGIKNAQELAKADISTITAIPGFGEVRAARVKQAAADAIAKIGSEQETAPKTKAKPKKPAEEKVEKTPKKDKKKKKGKKDKKKKKG